MSSNKRLHVAIIGAGTGGLSLSAALGYMDLKKHLEIDIYEASSCITDVGNGISIWPRTWEVMKAMGFQEQFLSFLPCPPDSSPRFIAQIRKSDQAQGFFIHDLIRNGGADKGDEVLLHFENGTIATCDLLIGMDGINSNVRKGFLSSRGLLNSPSMHPAWSGSTIFRALVPMERLKEAFPGHRALNLPMLYAGKSKHVVTYPISQDKLLNIVAYYTDVSKAGRFYDGPNAVSCSAEEVLSVYEGWEEEVQVILRAIDGATKWIARALVPLDCYALNRVVLAGDAAHTMTPHQGAGAGQAIKPGNRAVEMSALTGELCEPIGPGLEDIVEGDTNVSPDVLARVFQEYADAYNWVFEESPHEDRKYALEMLHSKQLSAKL